MLTFYLQNPWQKLLYTPTHIRDISDPTKYIYCKSVSPGESGKPGLSVRPSVIPFVGTVGEYKNLQGYTTLDMSQVAFLPSLFFLISK